MSGQWRYTHPTTPAGPGFDVEIEDAVQVGAGQDLAARAAIAEAEQTTVTVDDPDAIYDFKGLHGWRFIETECAAGNQLVWLGYIGAQSISRAIGLDGRVRTGAARGWELEVTEVNAIFGFRVIWDTDGDRPAETATERLEWLLSTEYLPLVDHGLVADASGVDMDACDYRGQRAADVISDLCIATGYTCWARYHEASGDVEIWFDNPNTSTADTSSLRISNVLADIDGSTTFEASGDPSIMRLRRDPSRIAAGVFLPYANGSIYTYDYDISYEWAFRDQTAPNANVKSSTAAQAIADRFLAENDEQDERITDRILLPAAHVNDLKQGQRLEVRYSHLPGYQDWRWVRCVRRSVSVPENRTERFYQVDIELSPQVAAETIVVGIFMNSYADTNPPTWPDGWTELLAWECDDGPQYPGAFTPTYPRLGIWAATGPLDGRSVTVTNPTNLGNAHALAVFELLNVESSTPVIAKLESQAPSDVPNVRWPGISTSGPALILSAYATMTSAVPRNGAPDAGFTRLFHSWCDLGDRMRQEYGYRIVTEATDLDPVDFTGGVWWDNTAAVALLAFPGLALVDLLSSAWVERPCPQTNTQITVTLP